MEKNTCALNISVRIRFDKIKDTFLIQQVGQGFVVHVKNRENLEGTKHEKLISVV